MRSSAIVEAGEAEGRVNTPPPPFPSLSHGPVCCDRLLCCSRLNISCPSRRGRPARPCPTPPSLKTYTNTRTHTQGLLSLADRGAETCSVRGPPPHAVSQVICSYRGPALPIAAQAQPCAARSGTLAGRGPAGRTRRRGREDFHFKSDRDERQGGLKGLAPAPPWRRVKSCVGPAPRFELQTMTSPRLDALFTLSYRGAGPAVGIYKCGPRHPLRSAGRARLAGRSPAVIRVHQRGYKWPA